MGKGWLGAPLFTSAGRDNLTQVSGGVSDFLKESSHFQFVFGI